MFSVERISKVTPKLFVLYRKNIFRHLALQRRLLYKMQNHERDPRVEAFREKLIYCDYLDSSKVRIDYITQQILKSKREKREKIQREEEHINTVAYSVLLDNEIDNQDETKELEAENIDQITSKPIHMPYARIDKLQMVETAPEDVNKEDKPKENLLNEKYMLLYEKYLNVKQNLGKDKEKTTFHDYVKTETQSKVPENWMADYEQFDDVLLEDPLQDKNGTPDPNSKVSCVPCNGCGSLLHCKDPNLPGYLPSELFKNKKDKDLKRMSCQRCHFLKYYNTALEVKVSPEEYPNLLKVIKTKKCAVILIVDLTDCPCSIWPDLKSVLHPLTPIFLVGNKVDLLPPDSNRFFDNLKDYLTKAVQDITKVNNIVHTGLISAKTGYGIEELINKLHKKWKYKGDVYLVGCTNAGKSSLFNTLVKSDYCKTQAINLIRPATISPWPGTTLNLLKFPILNPLKWRLYQRQERLRAEQRLRQAEAQYKREKFIETRQLKYATLERDVKRTFQSKLVLQDGSIKDTQHLPDIRDAVFDETKNEYKNSRWCYDTPGTIQRDQVLDLLTTDELLLTLPKKIVPPRSFILKQGQTMFLAGLGRIDFVEGRMEHGEQSELGESQNNAEATFEDEKQQIAEDEHKLEHQSNNETQVVEMEEETKEIEDKEEDGNERTAIEDEEAAQAQSIRCTLFASLNLPITMCYTVDADEVYRELLKTDAFAVPAKDPERLKLWPALDSKELDVMGVDPTQSAADVILSSAGWVAITPRKNQRVILRAWTPEGRGLHLRTPALLKHAIMLRGKRARGTPIYNLGRKVYHKINLI